MTSAFSHIQDRLLRKEQVTIGMIPKIQPKESVFVLCVGKPNEKKEIKSVEE